MKTTFAILAAVIMICGFTAPALAIDFHYFWANTWDQDGWPLVQNAIGDEVLLSANLLDELGFPVAQGVLALTPTEGPLHYDYEEMEEFEEGGDFPDATQWEMQDHDGGDWDCVEPVLINERVGPWDLDAGGNNPADPEDWLYLEE